eukprot:PhM_4_TR18062/c1_g1_i4/m.78266
MYIIDTVVPRTSPVQNIFGGALACALPPEYMDVAMTKIQHHSHSKTNDDDGPLGDNEEMYVHAPTDSRIHIELLEALPLGVGTGGDTAPAHTTADTRGVADPFGNEAELVARLLFGAYAHDIGACHTVPVDFDVPAFVHPVDPPSALFEFVCRFPTHALTLPRLSLPHCAGV